MKRVINEGDWVKVEVDILMSKEDKGKVTKKDRSGGFFVVGKNHSFGTWLTRDQIKKIPKIIVKVEKAENEI